LRFPALMLDTADKLAGSLFDVTTVLALSRFVLQVRGAGALAGLAGALRVAHLPQLAALAPDFAGFRSAVCTGARSGAIDAARLRDLVAALHGNRVHATPA
jgi:(5-formylfuran-3-yl)methyl phosphate synthase